MGGLCLNWHAFASAKADARQQALSFEAIASKESVAVGLAMPQVFWQLSE
jgi:hypothetical protein